MGDEILFEAMLELTWYAVNKLKESKDKSEGEILYAEYLNTKKIMLVSGE